MIAGAAALVVAAAGAVSVGSAQVAQGGSTHAESSRQPAGDISRRYTTDRVPAGDTVINSDGRGTTISRSSARKPIGDVDQQAIEKAAAERAEARSAALKRLARLADKRAEVMESRLWVLPVDHYRLTATFGQGGGLWASDHTGLDFAAPTGSPIRAVGHGIVTSTGYAGAYGTQTVITHDDGTQTTYSHQSDVVVRRGEEVEAGEIIGHIGMTGNTTGPHLHLEVRPNPETPVDPYKALVRHGLTP
ncbi:MAG TPA: M23 family metallopeptidase [Nocardioidaceae bacterium]|nr:M23 family metallopeptidase [Nocardioidaceae bacterium]